MIEIPADIESFLRSRLGPIARADDVSWEHRLAEVWYVQTATGREIFVKRHGRKEKLLREALAYETWVPFIPEHAPQLIAVDREGRGLLVLDKARGRMAKTVALSPGEERALYRLAGELLAKIHAIPLETAAGLGHPIEASAVLDKERAGFERWLLASKDLIDAGTLDWVRGSFAELGPPFPPVVVIHGDYSPRNWVVEASASGLALRLIDFERMGPNFAPIELRFLCFRQFATRLELRDAFCEGYGFDLLRRHADFYRRHLAYHAMAQVTWARQHGDPPFEAEGRALLERLRRGDEPCAQGA